MDMTEQRKGNLDNVRASAVGFRVVGIVSMLLGFLLVAVAVLRGMPILDQGVGAVAALIVELREIV
jgi:hypothetical protein